MTGKFTRYHLRAPFADSWKLIRHIRFLVNEKALKCISHEGTESGDTYIAIILKESVSKAAFDNVIKNLESLGLNPI